MATICSIGICIIWKIVTYLQRYQRLIMEKNQITEETNVLFDQLMKGYEPSPFLTSNWPMQDGVYREYSEYENNDSCPSGTSGSVKSIAL